MSTNPSIKQIARGSWGSSRSSRIVDLRAGQDRSNAANRMTGIAMVDAQPPPDFRRAFLGCYSDLRETVTRFEHQGVAIVAVDRRHGRAAGSLCMAAKPNAINAGIVGRHSSCDLFLSSDSTLSLRHLAVIIEPLRSWDASDTRFRVLDLRTRTAFCDEQGNRVESIVAEGPAFLVCGDYLLFCFPTGGLEWPERAADTWDCLPERVYVHERAAEPDRWQRSKPLQPLEDPTRVRSPDFNRRITYVGTSPGPIPSPFALLGDDEKRIGVLQLGGAGAARRDIILGARSAQRGVLLGRYERCDDGGSHRALSSEAVSRVHLLIVRLDDGLYAVDAGSSNGTWLLDESGRWQRQRCLQLRGGETLCLGSERAEIRWTSL